MNIAVNTILLTKQQVETTDVSLNGNLHWWITSKRAFVLLNYEYLQEKNLRKHQQDGRQTKTDAKLPASARPGWSARTPTQSTPFTWCSNDVILYEIVIKIDFNVAFRNKYVNLNCAYFGLPCRSFR